MWPVLIKTKTTRCNQATEPNVFEKKSVFQNGFGIQTIPNPKYLYIPNQKSSSLQCRQRVI